MTTPPTTAPAPQAAADTDPPATAAATTKDNPWTVRHLSGKMVDYIAKMPAVWVEGQLLEVKHRAGTRLAYLTLRDLDVDVSLPLTCSPQLFKTLDSSPAEGDQVVVRVKPEMWARRGSLNLMVHEIFAVGEGALLAQIEKLRRQLQDEGLFDPALKKPLPFLPKTIGLICGRGSAAERDVIVTASARWPGIIFEKREVAVQGPTAARAVTAALAELDQLRQVEVIIIARGGGSLEDLLPFSDESLLRAVASCHTPVISAIGHEVDCPLLDYVADVRGRTPTDAGRLVVPDHVEEREHLSQARIRIRQALQQRLQRDLESLTLGRERLTRLRPHALIQTERDNLATARERLVATVASMVQQARRDLEHLQARVRAVNITNTIARGFVVVHSSTGELVPTREAALTHHHLTLRFADGLLPVTVNPPTTPEEK